MGGSEDLLLRVAREALLLVLVLSAPALLASLVVGLVVGLLQATTQVQEPTLTFVPKLLAVFLVLALSAPWMGVQLLRFTQAVFEALPRLAGS
jgi:flagellar biosynthetic protein FliQ